MTLKDKKRRLEGIYKEFEADAEAYRKDAICRLGCTYCCTDVGSIDTTTLEGYIIWKRISGLSRRLRLQIDERIVQNRLEKQEKNIARCPFLKEDDACLIYDIRPFSCRQLYSLRECRGRGPTVHRQVVAMAKEAVKKIQRVDDTGYSGHLTFILHLFDRTDFRTQYLSGSFDPGSIAGFGKAHRLVINRFAK